jgi:hypothetical protein
MIEIVNFIDILIIPGLMLISTAKFCSFLPIATAFGVPADAGAAESEARG